MADEQVFADGIGAISMIGGTVRLDFLSYSPTEADASGQPRAVFRQRVIMGLEAFLATAEKIHEAAEALSARRTEVPPQPAPAAPVTSLRPAVEPAPEPPPPAPATKPPFP